MAAIIIKLKSSSGCRNKPIITDKLRVIYPFFLYKDVQLSYVFEEKKIIIT